ncbi:hypothetical protein C8Q80DRAFT_1141790 [Daedaleopsis nitida]|nr:hypothetical protein C8Q80DRAFT_1141790 [Daedaleopsis nitida]
MPSFATSTVVRDSAYSLNIALNVRCVLVAGAPLDTVYALTGRVPRDIDVILQSNLVLALSGSQNRVKVSASSMQNSAVAKHLVKYLHANGEQLGLRVASDVFVDEEDGNTKRAYFLWQQRMCTPFCTGRTNIV